MACCSKALAKCTKQWAYGVLEIRYRYMLYYIACTAPSGVQVVRARGLRDIGTTIHTL